MPSGPYALQATMPNLVNANRFASAQDVSLHVHPGIELVLVTEGACAIGVEGRELEGNLGTLFVLPAQVPQYQKSLGFTRTTYVVFRAPGFDGTARTIDLEQEKWLGRWMGDLCDLHAAHEPVPEGITGGLLLALLERIGHLEERQNGVAGMDPRLARAVAFLRESFDRPIDGASLAAHAHLSASHLAALFRRQFGCGPLAYQQSLRMALARKLLLDPYLTVAEVARTCGYEDANYFGRLFQKCHGRAPGKWRKEQLTRIELEATHIS